MDLSTQIQKDIKTLVEGLGFQFLDNPMVHEEDDRFFVDIFVNEPQNLIGERGTSLASLQMVMRLIAAKKYRPDIRLDIDVNGYKKKRAEFIKDMAHQARKQVLSRRAPVALEPMTAFDRRVIHTTLASFADVSTGSEGMGPGRHVVVSPQQHEGGEHSSSHELS
ncbi:MAG: R3H domain-containing nucleic acid-binding protein [Candidatus Spechtbacterales bacterium]